MTEVSAGIIRRGDGRILICQRGEGRKNAHLWEFPGGKREAGESAADCLKRELMEELALPVTDIAPLCENEAQGIHFTFLTARTDAAPVPTEHEDVRFVRPQEMAAYPFCPADVPVARKLAFAGVRHFLWDFDGTLMDTYPAMVRAFVAAAADFGVAVEAGRALELMKNCLTHALTVISAESDLDKDALYHAFRAHEEEVLPGVPLVAGVRETLTALHDAGAQHYVVTHRDLRCREMLDSAGVLPLFAGFVTQEDGLPRKPAPDMLVHLMDKHGLAPESCAMVGDRPLDTEAGRHAGMLSVLLDAEGRFPCGEWDVKVGEVQELLGFCG